MILLRHVLRWYSYLFHFLLALFLLGIGIVVTQSPGFDVRIGFLPLKSEEIVPVFITTAIIGIITILLAVTRLFPYAFPVYALIVLVQSFRWLLFLNGATFSGREEFEGALWLLAGIFGAFLSSLTVLKQAPRKGVATQSAAVKTAR